MTHPAAEITGSLEVIKAACRKAGIKLTAQRLEVFREVADSTDHPNAETVYLGVQKRLTTVSLDTVYRTLWLLEDLGLITTLGPHRGSTRFEANLKPHHHYVCTRCGMTRDLYHEDFDRISVPAEAHSFGTVQTTQVEIRGVCTHCTETTSERRSKGPVRE
jgi:Fur family peroxide stress response transcriptional regulator